MPKSIKILEKIIHENKYENLQQLYNKYVEIDKHETNKRLQYIDKLISNYKQNINDGKKYIGNWKYFIDWQDIKEIAKVNKYILWDDLSLNQKKQISLKDQSKYMVCDVLLQNGKPNTLIFLLHHDVNGMRSKYTICLNKLSPTKKSPNKTPLPKHIYDKWMKKI
jgi:hypothetical protein